MLKPFPTSEDSFLDLVLNVAWQFDNWIESLPALTVRPLALRQARPGQLGWLLHNSAAVNLDLAADIDAAKRLQIAVSHLLEVVRSDEQF